MSDTRKEILTVAKRLFNERGFNVVSTGDISKEVGISKGNLTYYFKKKEDIVEAILLETPSTRSKEVPSNLRELNEFFLDMQRTIKDNAFYFWHHTQLAQLSPNIGKSQDEAYRINFKILTNTLEILQNNQLLRKEIGRDGHLIDLLLISIIYWVPFNELKKGDEDEKTFINHIWGIIYSYLTNKGKEFEKIGINK